MGNRMLMFYNKLLPTSIGQFWQRERFKKMLYIYIKKSIDGFV